MEKRMPRKPRTDYAGAWHHLMNRGAGRLAIFRDDDDRKAFLDCLSSAGQAAQMEIHGYCLMGNHFHLLVHSKVGMLSDFMRLLSGRYSRQFNQRWSSDGPIFRARTLSVEISSDAHLVSASRYIHLNPVEAGFVSRPEAWPWSSAAAFLGREPPPDWLVVFEILEMFSGLASGVSYAEFMAERVDDKTVRFYNEQGWI